MTSKIFQLTDSVNSVKIMWVASLTMDANKVEISPKSSMRAVETTRNASQLLGKMTLHLLVSNMVMSAGPEMMAASMA